MSKPKKVHAWVHPDFHKALKTESAERGLSMIDYTEQLARRRAEEDDDREQKKRRGGDWRFGF